MARKPDLTYRELEEQLVSHRAAIDAVLQLIDQKPNKDKKVSQAELEDYELTIKGFDDTSTAKVEMTGRARVSC